jgi:chromosome partitioning protein
MALIIAVVQRKGGVGKTTIALGLAGEFNRRGYRVVVVDSDSQRSASQWAEPGLLPFEVRELPLERHEGRAWAQDLAAIRSELVVVDTPPNEYAVAAAIAVAAVAVMPCTPSGLDLEATEQALAIVREVRARRGDNVAVLLAPNRVDARTLEGQQLVSELHRFGEPVAAPVGARSAFVRAFSSGETIQDFAPDSAADMETRKLADRVLDMLRQRKRSSL